MAQWGTFLQNVSLAQRQRAEEEKLRNTGPNWGNILLGAASAYLTAGLAPALVGGAASLAANPTTVIAGIKGAAEGYGSKSGEEAAIKGTVQGITPTIETWEAQRKAAKDMAVERAWKDVNPQMKMKKAEIKEGIPTYEYIDPSIVDPITMEMMNRLGIAIPSVQLNNKSAAITAVDSPIGTIWTDNKTGKRYKKTRPSTSTDEGWEIF